MPGNLEDCQNTTGDYNNSTETLKYYSTPTNDGIAKCCSRIEEKSHARTPDLLEKYESTIATLNDY
eukprot:6389738-Amphidinium_carterae.1